MILSALAMGCCTTGLAPNVAYATGHDVETKAKLAQADLVVCKSDTTQCAALDSDLKALVETGNELQQAALKAGYKPEETQP